MGDNAGKTTMTKEEVELHVIPGKVALDGLKKDTTTVQGKTLSYQRFARQDYLDDAIIGQTPQGPATGQVHPSTRLTTATCTPSLSCSPSTTSARAVRMASLPSLKLSIDCY